MNQQSLYFSRKILLPTLVIVGITVSGCITKGDIDQFVKQNSNQGSEQGLGVSVTQPVDRDWQEIKDSGVLRMITRYSTSTYFLYKGIEEGFEYELVRQFANEHNLALQIVIVGPNENPYDLLNSGAGDLIAANYTITPDRRKYVQFTRPYNMVNQLIVYSNAIENPPENLQQLAQSGIPISVRQNSSYFQKLQELKNEGYNLNIQQVSGDMNTESILSEVAQGKSMATVSDDNIYHAANNYMNGLEVGPTIARNDTIAWAIRKNAPNLETEMNRFLYKHFRFSPQDGEPKRSTFLNVLRKRYFVDGRQVASQYNPPSDIETSSIISPYDDLIKQVADSAGIDWLMVASIAAQETKFNPDSKSWAGAVGLMQVQPQYSQVPQEKLLYDAKINLKEGVRIIAENLRQYSYMDSTNQWEFALATYNAGTGHIADARRLAIDQNRNPNEWDNVADALLKLMQRNYYKDARFGFCRGIETVRYVKEIMNRRKTYQSILAMSQQKQQQGLGILGMLN